MADYVVGRVGDFIEGKGQAFRIGRRTLAVFRTRSGFAALPNRCIHRGASLCDGEVVEDGAYVRCPWHNWSFDLATGACRVSEQERVRTFPVRVVGDDVIVTV